MSIELKTKRDQLVAAVEQRLRDRDRSNLWLALKPGTLPRAAYVDAVRLLRGGVDLDSPKIAAILHDMK